MATCSTGKPDTHRMRQCTPVRLDTISLIATARGRLASTTLLEARTKWGEPCWNIFAGDASGGIYAGTPFRCGTTPRRNNLGQDHQMNVFDVTSGHRGQVNTSDVVLVGVVGNHVARVRVQLANGTTQNLELHSVPYGTSTLRAFAYANTTSANRPRLVQALDDMES
jgi:hypothetical protein